MITTKGYFYFEHLNPKHNIKARKIRPLSIENNNTNELPSQKLNQVPNVGAIVGRSYSNHKTLNLKEQHSDLSKKKIDSRLNLDRLQKILTNSSKKKSKQKEDKRNYEEITDFKQTERKNTISSEFLQPLKIHHSAKKQKLRGHLLRSQNRKSRPFSNLSHCEPFNELTCSDPQQQIRPSMSGVFIPSKQLKTKIFNKHIRRYHTSFKN